MVEGQELLRDLMSWCQVGASWPQFWQKNLKIAFRCKVRGTTGNQQQFYIASVEYRGGLTDGAVSGLVQSSSSTATSTGK